MKLTEVFSEKRMAGRCETNQVFLKKERPVAVKLTEVFFKKRITGRCEKTGVSKKNGWSL